MDKVKQLGNTLIIAGSLLFFLLINGIACAQQNTVNGTVRDDSTGNPLPGVNIKVKGTTTGTTTNGSGHYSFNVPSLRDTLIFSYIGYKTKIVPVNGRTTVNVSLKSETIAGQQMVVVGYGTQSSESLTGSVSSVSGSDLDKASTVNTSESLGGKIPGLVMVNYSGEPGHSAPVLRIRGQHTLTNNKPLVVINGIPNPPGGLNSLNPNDIKSISVLKDATAAIYGVRGANGVILVTTKQGKKGPSKVGVTFNQGFQQPTRLPKMADAATYLTMLNELSRYQGNPPVYSKKEIQKYADPNSNPWLYPNTNWFKEGLKSFSMQTKGNVTVSGGSKTFQYRFSLGALRNGGIYVNSATHYNRYNIRSALSAEPSDNLHLQFDISGRWENRNYSSQNGANIFRYMVQSYPNYPGFWPNGKPGPAIELGNNPVVMGSSATGSRHNDSYYFNSRLHLNYDIPHIKGLSVKGTGSFDKNFLIDKRFTTPWTLYSFNKTAYIANGKKNPSQYLTGVKRGPATPTLNQQSTNGDKILLNAIGQYKRDLGNNSFNVLFGSEYQYSQSDYFSAFRRNFLTAAIPEMFAGGKAGQTIDGNGSHGAHMSFFSRINYNYKNKYIVQLIGRYEGSYIFPKGKRYGFFPGISVGWRLANEKFVPAFFDELKLTGSYGETGNDQIAPYQYLNTYSFGAGYVNNDKKVPTLVPGVSANPNVTWEVAKQTDVGIHTKIFNRKLSFELHYWNEIRNNILAFRSGSVPSLTGLKLPRENIGKVRSWGYDGSISWDKHFTKDINYSISLNGGYSTNKIKYIAEPKSIPQWQRQTGKKMGAGLFYIATGVFHNKQEISNHPHEQGARPGDLIFKDVNGDGKITAKDRVRINRNNYPTWTGGLTLRAQYKNLHFKVFFQGNAGASKYVRTASGTFGNYYQQYAARRWTPEHPNANGPRAYNRQQAYWIAQENTYFFRKTNFLRLKNAKIGYTLPKKIVSKLDMDSVQFYINGYNLITWTSYKLGDPETANPNLQGFQNTIQNRGGSYPQMRLYNIGFSLKF